jgi:hypothetical protein
MIRIVRYIRHHTHYSTSFYRDVVLRSIEERKIDYIQLGYEAICRGHQDVIDDIEEIQPGTYKKVFDKAYSLNDKTTCLELEYLIRNDAK